MTFSVHRSLYKFTLAAISYNVNILVPCSSSNIENMNMYSMLYIFQERVERKRKTQYPAAVIGGGLAAVVTAVDHST